MQTSLVVQWLRLYASNAGGMGLIPGQGPKIPLVTWHGQGEKKRMNVIHWYVFLECQQIQDFKI